MDREAVLKVMLADNDVKNTISLLEVVLGLVRKYGKKLTMPEFIKGVEMIHKDVADLICLLDSIHLLKEKELSRFIRDLKKKVDEKYLDFTLYSNDRKTIPPLKVFIERKFGKNAKIEYENVESDNLTVNMKGHGYWFKRSLEDDIDKLLA